MTPRPVFYRIPSDSNLLYLPFVYLLPEDTIAKCPTLRTLTYKFLYRLYHDAFVYDNKIKGIYLHNKAS